MAARRASPLDLKLDKRIPVNQRYSGIKSVVDTGATVKKIKTVTSRQYHSRRDEIFRRVPPALLHELLEEYEGNAQEDVTLVDADAGFAAGPRVASYTEKSEPTYERPYLILDVRPQREFMQAHVVQARPFPATLLNQDRITPEIHRFRNRESSLIVLYAWDERAAAEAAERFIQRGYENIFVLSGGLAAFAAASPAFVEGTLPPELQAQLPAQPENKSPNGRRPPRSGLARQRSSPAPSRAAPAEGRSPGASRGSAPGRLTPRKLGAHDRAMSSGSVHRMRRMVADGRSRSSSTVGGDADDARSRLSTLSVADSVISRSTAMKGRFR